MSSNTMFNQPNVNPMNAQTVNMGQNNTYQNIPKIRVVVRKRPLNKKELQRGEQSIVEIRNNRQVVVKELRTKVDLTKYIEEHTFTFDMAFDEQVTNEAIYMETVRPMIEAAFNKTKVTCFAYGQTGSGKTFTMMGNGLNRGIPGLYLLGAYDIFRLLQLQQYQGFTIWASFYEIYCGKLFDLLNERKQLNAREDGKQNIIIVGLVEKRVNDLNEMMGIIQFGLRSRTVGVTGANSDSSRSHAIIQITIKDQQQKMHGKISFIDLAGSERAADVTDTNKQTRLDGAEINKSLLALKECIRALDQDKKHTPFRGSKLTLVLRDSFIGNCKTLMIANISPALGCTEHTLNTLRYADRVKELRGKPEVNIGAGNVNMNYDPVANAKKNEGKDPNEVLANLLMMPRDHKNTVTYNVNPITLSEHKPKKATKNKKKPGHRKTTGSLNSSFSDDSNSLNSSASNNNFGFLGMESNSGGFMGSDVLGQFNPGRNTMSNFMGNPMLNYGQTQNGFGQPQPNQMKSISKGGNKMSINNQINIYNGTSNHPFSTQGSKSPTMNQMIPSNQMGFPLMNDPSNKKNIPNEGQIFQSSKKTLPKNPMMNVNISDNVSLTAKQPTLINSLLVNQGSGMEDTFNFLNDYTSYNNQNQQNQQNEAENQNGEDISALKATYEQLVNQIMTEEKEIIEFHKKNIDNRVNTLKVEMSLLTLVEQESNVDEYLQNEMDALDAQAENISLMKQKIQGFKDLLKEEAELNRRINGYSVNEGNLENNQNNQNLIYDEEFKNDGELNESNLNFNNTDGKYLPNDN
ncbi:MAG: hypothetical protein MJ252_04485 [archaeon]|nr:hypothetical protein [archaeon]